MKNCEQNSPKTITFSFVAGLRGIFGVNKVARPPIALYKSPRTSNINGIPRIAEPIIFESHARLVAGRFTVTLNYDAVQSGVTRRKL